MVILQVIELYRLYYIIFIYIYIYIYICMYIIHTSETN